LQSNLQSNLHLFNTYERYVLSYRSVYSTFTALRSHLSATPLIPFALNLRINICIITAPVVPTACLRVRCTNHSLTRLTNQGGAHQYIDYAVYFNTKDSYHHPNEHIILYVFRAPGYDSLVLLSWYKY
jgi:hypothetical protein